MPRCLPRRRPRPRPRRALALARARTLARPLDFDFAPTLARASQVCLATCAARIGLHAFVLLGESSAAGVRWAACPREDPLAYEKMLADLFEAFIGAVYLDQGLDAVRTIYAQVLYPFREDLPLRRVWLAALQQDYTEPDPLDRDPDAAAAAEAALNSAPGVEVSAKQNVFPRIVSKVELSNMMK